jgi:carboxyvinyl-carboxyphosphonate phosphorylmutase
MDEALSPRTGLLQALQGQRCVRLASVFDPLSARIAAELEFEGCIFAGSVASLAVLAAPDLALLTLTELADQVRQIRRVGAPPLLVDADHGYGNALGAVRTVDELYAAGAAAITLEDTLLPRSFGGPEMELVGIDEAIGKLEAAVEARANADLAVVARTSAYRTDGIAAACERVARFARTGADAIFVPGVRTLEEVAAVRDAAGGLPQIVYATGEVTAQADLAGLGVRMLIEGHAPIVAAAEAVWDALSAQRDGRPLPAARHPGLMQRLSRGDAYEARTARYLHPRSTADGR